jgi:hypothetical protein
VDGKFLVLGYTYDCSLCFKYPYKLFIFYIKFLAFIKGKSLSLFSLKNLYLLCTTSWTLKATAKRTTSASLLPCLRLGIRFTEAKAKQWLWHWFHQTAKQVPIRFAIAMPSARQTPIHFVDTEGNSS